MLSPVARDRLFRQTQNLCSFSEQEYTLPEVNHYTSPDKRYLQKQKLRNSENQDQLTISNLRSFSGSRQNWSRNESRGNRNHVMSVDRDQSKYFLSQEKVKCYYNHVNVKNKIESVLGDPKMLKFSGLKSPHKLRIRLANVQRAKKMSILNNLKVRPYDNKVTNELRKDREGFKVDQKYTRVLSPCKRVRKRKQESSEKANISVDFRDTYCEIKNYKKSIEKAFYEDLKKFLHNLEMK